MSEADLEVQCPCGRKISCEADYNIVFLKKELKEIDILCPNRTCYLVELGFIKFDIVNDKPVLDIARFYSPFVTWNATQKGDQAQEILKSHLKGLISKEIDWKKIIHELENLDTREKPPAEKNDVTGEI
ncbi:MAG: hypothetical protein ACFFD4_13890 [Candidatus Odinarchaeota archaeon]